MYQGFLKWVFGKLFDAALENIAEHRELQAKLNQVVKNWANSLPKDEFVVPKALFPDVEPSSVETELNCYHELQQTLKKHCLPSQELWHSVFLESWHYVKRNVAEPQPFFQIPEARASEKLKKLAGDVFKVCNQHWPMFSTYAVEQLGKIDEIRDGISVLGRELGAVKEDIQRGQEGEPRASRTNLPYLSIGDLFKGREDMVEKLRSALGAGKTAAITQVHAIHGLGGVGKTRLAVEFAWRALEEGQYWGVFFVVSDTEANLNTNLGALAESALLNLPEQNSKEQPIIVEAVLRELERRTGWLIIFDNVDSDKSAKRLREEILPRLSAGDALLTSRRSNWPDDIADLPIDKLAEPDAIAYLLEKTERKRAKSAEDKELAKKVAHELDCLPVALEQAGGYINQRRIGLNTYLKELNESRQKVLSWHSKELLKYPVAVLATWHTTEEHLEPRERAILRLASFLAPEAIPVALFESQPELISSAGKLLFEEIDQSSKSRKFEKEFNVRELLAILAGWSMITLSESNFTIHRLVQDSIRLSIPQKQQKAWAELATGLVNDYIPGDLPPDDVRSWHIWTEIEPHVAALVAHADSFGITEPTTRLMNELGLYLKYRARYNQAEPLYKRALEIDEKSFGKDHTNVAIDLNNLAALLQDTNRLKEAEPIYRRVIKIFEKSLGSEHPNVATALNNLAQLLESTNRLKEAEPLIRRALEIDEKSFGKDHPDVAIDLNNLAALLKDTNRLKEAEPLMRRALDIDEKSFGKDHPRVAIRLNNLAQLLQDTNRLKEAEPLMRRALQIDEKSFGKDHPTVAIDLNNLALLLKATNRLKESEPLMRRALEIDEKSFGKDHPKVAIRLNNLAALLKDTNHPKEAEPLMRRALEIFEKSLGPDHPNTQVVRRNLERLKLSKGKQ